MFFVSLIENVAEVKEKKQSRWLCLKTRAQKFHSNLTLMTTVTRQKLECLITGQTAKQQYSPSLKKKKLQL
jgi:hypothetical protein